MTGDPRAGGWDCHTHLFGPYDRYPLAADRSYTPPPATETDYLAHLARLGLARGVLVHPSAYGDDHRLMLSALRAHPQWRGVAVKKDAPLAEMRSLRDQGVRALRFSQRSGPNANFAGSALFADLQRLAPAMAEAGLHAEIWTDCAAILALHAAIDALPVPLVIDHMGGFDWTRGTDEPGFQRLLALAASGKVWVKLSAYRNVLAAPGLEAARPFQEALLRANPERMLWGSDWPHLRIDPEPDARDLLAAFEAWTNDAALARRVLVDNPGALYG